MSLSSGQVLAIIIIGTLFGVLSFNNIYNSYVIQEKIDNGEYGEYENTKIMKISLIVGTLVGIGAIFSITIVIKLLMKLTTWIIGGIS